MVREVKIIDKKTGEVLREDYISATPTLLGFSIPDMFKIGGAILAVVVFFVNGQNDKDFMQKTLAAQQVTLSRLTDFKENSDSWNTYAYGTRFLDGQPLDRAFKIDNNKGIVNH